MYQVNSFRGKSYAIVNASLLNKPFLLLRYDY